MPTVDPISWLRDRVGTEALPGSAFDAAMSFALLWMYFEGQACSTEANSKNLRAFATDLYARKPDELRGKLDEPLRYFKERYKEVKSDPQQLIRRLGDPNRINKNDQAAIISTLTKEIIDEVDKAIGLLIICFRIRNNLFHGSKQISTLQQQQDLFAQVSSILIVLLNAR